jgi:DNA repair exonuclease SbcCD ATPase subunit
MVATELITGIEELVNHIRELEMKNKKLEEDLKTQTTRADAWEKSYQDKCSVDQEEKYQPKGSRIDPEGLHDYMKEENKKLEEENKKLKEENKKLKEQLEKAWDQRGDKLRKARIKNLVAENKKLQEKIKEYNESDKHLNKCIDSIRDQYLEQKEENKELKEDLNDKVHWQQTMVSYIDDGDGWCHFDRWFGETIDEDDKKQEWVKMWMENIEYEDSEDSYEEPDSP